MSEITVRRRSFLRATLAGATGVTVLANTQSQAASEAGWFDEPSQRLPLDDDADVIVPYDIPLRALIAKDVDGLMMAGRCISGDFVAHASYRVTGNAVAMGEAAGAVAAIAAQSDRLPHEVSWKEGAQLLTETGLRG